MTPVEGRVVNVTDFGLFIDIYDGLEGFVHVVSEIDIPAGKLEDHYFKVGEFVPRAHPAHRGRRDQKVGLTMRGVDSADRADEIAELDELLLPADSAG